MLAIDVLIDEEQDRDLERMLQLAALIRGASPVTVLGGTSASEGVEEGVAESSEEGDASTDTDDTEFDYSAVTWQTPTEESLAADLAMLGASGGSTTVNTDDFDTSPDSGPPMPDDDGMEWL